MGRFFLFREVRPRGDVPMTCGFEEALKDNQTMTSFPLHRSPPKQIVLAKQPIIKYNRRKEKHLLETIQQGN
jgi:hypothetical protein